MRQAIGTVFMLGLLGGGCGDAADGAAALGDPFDVPVDGATAAEVTLFHEGDGFFDAPFSEAEGLGPLFIRKSCGACHVEAARGPGLVQKVALVEADGVTPSADQSRLPFGHTIRLGLSAGATRPIEAPKESGVKVSIRIGPPVLGRGYMEAVADSEIERVAAEQAQRGDGIRGRVNYVRYASEGSADEAFHRFQKGQRVIGRFGLKARVATLDDFSADAYQGDMGITSALRPEEPPNPEGLRDDAKAGVDLDREAVRKTAGYLRLIGIPRRSGLSEQGAALFREAQCAACHVPTLRTRADYPIAAIAGKDAPLFTDLLVHRLGSDLADGLAEGEAAASWSWRTAPLIGLRFNTALLHDGRAATVDEAILAHDGEGSEAADSVRRYRALGAAERATLIDYVKRL